MIHVVGGSVRGFAARELENNNISFFTRPISFWPCNEIDVPFVMANRCISYD